MTESGQRRNKRPLRFKPTQPSLSSHPSPPILPKALTLVCAAQARASRVFPVPGGPYISTPFGGWIPKFSNFSLWFIGRTMASTSCQEEDLGEDSEPCGLPQPNPLCSAPLNSGSPPSPCPTSRGHRTLTATKAAGGLPEQQDRAEGRVKNRSLSSGPGSGPNHLRSQASHSDPPELSLLNCSMASSLPP